MIPTSASKHRPASEVVARIQSDASRVKQKAQLLRTATSVTVQQALDALATFRDAMGYMGQFAGDQRIIDYANAEAAKDQYFPTEYNVSTDYGAYSTAVQNVIAGLIGGVIPVDQTGHVLEKYLQPDGSWSLNTISRTTLDTLNTDLDAILSVLD
ncbi:MAG: hypothetical protein D6712_18880 [Chloroflexi bacterium]|nr:MAG: hypothetical protein D6712_18880 [Chloroflexota bacterium]